ncbi:MAG: amidohydrolase family protein [Candidatus Obscuribacterales bacterium]|nr:amidohydrolase family protein [Candidatus Obscuribacterales bacterium]
MSAISLVGGTLITPHETKANSITCVDGKIAAIGQAQGSGRNNQSEISELKTIDVSGCYVTPGLIDIQVNGGPSCNFWGDPTIEQVQALSADMLKAGVTTILPTLITDDISHIRKNIEFLKSIGVGKSAALKSLPIYMPGIHLEGPCLSKARPGVHPPQHIQPLTVEILAELVDNSVILMTLAPEEDPEGEALAFLRKNKIFPSLGHSNATLEQANTAFDRGVELVTHLFNAMPPLHHRAPGAVTAALLDDRVRCAVIADGKHLDKNAVKLVFKVKGADKVVLVTDAAFIGTTGGDLVGSSITLSEAVLNLVHWQIATFAQAILMATYNAALSIGLDDQIGQLAVGKRADLVVWDQSTLVIRHVVANGSLAYSSE